MKTSIRLIVGLGNPGRDYADTRHNVGFLVIDAFAAARRAAWQRARDFESELARIAAPAGGELVLMKPLTFMNDSGRAVGAFCRYHRITPPEVVLVFDELNLPVGRAKLTVAGSAGGHNGLESVLQQFGDGFRRFRIGIGPRQPPMIDLKDYVLGPLTLAQHSTLTQKMPEFLAGLDLLLEHGVTRAMNQINRRPDSDDRSDQEAKI